MMSRLASLFAVPLALVSQEDLNAKAESNSSAPNGTAEDKNPGTSKVEENQNGEMQLNGNGPTKRKRKKKKQNQQTPVRTYIDYDKTLEDNESSGWVWQGASLFANGSQETPSHPCGAISPPAQREVVSYQELSHLQNSSRNRVAHQRKGNQMKHFPPGVQNGNSLLCQRNLNSLPHQQNSNNNSKPFKRKPNLPHNSNKIPRMNSAENDINGRTSLHSNALMNSYIDPLVAATEQKELFAKPPQPVFKPNGRKPLTSKQRKRIEKAKAYKEKLRLQQEKEKERIASLKQLPCRFFSVGSCTKGAECIYSHDFVPQKKPELCKFYVISFCEKGSNCVYYHNDWPCKFFHAYRSCTQGDRCRFSHLPLTDETRPLLEKALSDVSCQPMNLPGVPVPGQCMTPDAQRIFDARAQPPISFFGSSVVQPHLGMPWPMPPNGAFNGNPHMFHQPWNKKLEPIDVDDIFKPHCPTDIEAFINDPRIKEHLLRKETTVDYVAPYKRDPLVLLENPRVTYFCLDAPDSASYYKESKITNDSGSVNEVTENSDSECLAIDLSAAETEIEGSVVSSLSAINGDSDEVRTARHLSLPIMQIVACGGVNKFTRIKRGSVSNNDSPNLPSSSSSSSS